MRRVLSQHGVRVAPSTYYAANPISWILVARHRLVFSRRVAGTGSAACHGRFCLDPVCEVVTPERDRRGEQEAKMDDDHLKPANEPIDAGSNDNCPELLARPGGYRALWAISVLAVLACSALGGLLAQTRSDLNASQARVDEAVARAESSIDAAADELVESVESAGAVLQSRQGEVSAIRAQLEQLERSLYGIGGAGFGATSLSDLERSVSNLASCVNSNFSSLSLSSDYFVRRIC